jgi:hypothetical protein
MRVVLVVVALCSALGTVEATPAPKPQPRTPWERPVDGARIVAAATTSKALACLDAHYGVVVDDEDCGPTMTGAVLESCVARNPSMGVLLLEAAVFAGAIDSARRILAMARAARKTFWSVYASALDGRTSSDRSREAVFLLVEVGRLSDAAAAFAGCGEKVHMSCAEILAAIGRTEEAFSLAAAQPSDERLRFDHSVLSGLLEAAAPPKVLDRSVSMLLRDVDAKIPEIGLMTAARTLRGHGFADQARPLRRYLASEVRSSGDVHTLVNYLAPEVMAAGDDEERRELDALLAKLGADQQLEVRWLRAYYRGTVAKALALTRERPFPIDRAHDLRRLWARAAMEGFDPATMKAIDAAACALPP